VRRALALAAVALAAIVGLSVRAFRERTGDAPDFRLPERMRIDRLVTDLTADLDAGRTPDAVVHQRARAPVRVAALAPGARVGHSTGGPRTAIVAPAPALLRFRVDAGAGAALRFGIGVERGTARVAEADARDVRFTVRVDGREVWSRQVNPVRRDEDRRWWDARVDLGLTAPGEVEIALETAAVGPGRRAAGTPGWSMARVVEGRWRDRQAASAAHPSVLVLLVDTLRADALGVYGASPSPSPRLDALARDGLVFDWMIAQAPWTLPSVATLLTGLPPRSHGVTGSFTPDGAIVRGEGDASFLPRQLVTLPEHAEEAGITTVGVSTNSLVGRSTNFDQGFETFVDLDAHTDFAFGEPVFEPARAAEVNRTFLAWLRANRGRRFLGYLHYMEPHGPYTPEARFRPPVPDGVRPEIAAGILGRLARAVNNGSAPPLPPVEVGYLRRLYDGEIASWDAALATLLAGLDELGVRDSTVVVVVADHGEEFQEHGCLKHRVHLYDESIHVPFVLRGPGITPGRATEVVQGIDFFPTVSAVLELPPRSGLPGQNVLAARPPRPVVSETLYGRIAGREQTPLVSLRTRDWKLIRAPVLAYEELYDLSDDPGERMHRSDATRAAGLGATLAQALEGAAPPPPAEGRDPAIVEKLRALGYVQ
jgi:arylsulfatase A-like enzyme